MRRPWSAGLLVVLLRALVPLTGFAQDCPGVTTPLTPFAEESLLVTATPVFLTPSQYKNATMATVSVRNASASFFLVQTPTPTAGHHLEPGALYPICGAASIAAFRAVRETVDAILTVTYFRPKGP
jgi:hypothetical protein